MGDEREERLKSLTPDTLRALADHEDAGFPVNVHILDHADAWEDGVGEMKRPFDMLIKAGNALAAIARGVPHGESLTAAESADVTDALKQWADAAPGIENYFASLPVVHDDDTPDDSADATSDPSPRQGQG